MQDNQDFKQPEEPSETSGQTWREVGEQLHSLGETLAQALRSAWNDEENRRRVQGMRSGLEAMVSEVDQAIRETAESPKGQQVRGEAEKAIRSMRAAGEETYQEVRPHVISAMRQVEHELQKLINRMEEKSEAEEPSVPPDDPVI